MAADIPDQVYCDLCLELLTQLQSIQHQIGPRPAIPPTDKVKANFQHHPASAPCPPTQVCPQPSKNVCCVFCHERSCRYFCLACRRCLCACCEKEHSKLTECSQDKLIMFEDYIQQVRACVDAKIAQLSDSKQKLDNSKNLAYERTEASYTRCRKALKCAEEETIAEVRRWYEQQMQLLDGTHQENVNEMTRQHEDLATAIHQMVENILEVRRDNKSMLSMYELLQQKIENDLEKLNFDVFSPTIFEVENNEPDAFNPDKAMVVKVQQVSKARTAGFNICSCVTNINTLKLEKLGMLPSGVRQLQFVNRELWALMENRIEVLDETGMIKRTLEPGLIKAADMCQLKAKLIIADLQNGLLQLSTTDGRLVRQIDTGSYWSVTPCNDHQSIWGVKGENVDVGLSLCKFNLTTADQGYEVQTEIISNGKSVTCAELGNIVYLCVCHSHSIAAVDPSTGKTMCTYGEHGRIGPGELYAPVGVYSDEESNSLLVVDQFNNRLQHYDVVANRWKIIALQGEQVKRPQQATVDSKGQVWIICKDSLWYKFLYRSR